MKCHYTLTVRYHFDSVDPADVRTLDSNIRWSVQHASDNGMLTEDCLSAELVRQSHTLTLKRTELRQTRKTKAS